MARFWLVVFVVFSSIPLFAQAPGTASTAIPIPGVGHNYIGDLSEIVDPSAGSVSIRIPVPLPPGRRLSQPFEFAYDSNGVYVPMNLYEGTAAVWDGFETGYMTKGGWSYTVPAAGLTKQTYFRQYKTEKVGCLYYTNWRFVDANGGRHGLGLLTAAGGGPGGVCNLNETLAGGDLDFRAVVSTRSSTAGGLKVVDADGTAYSFSSSGTASTIEDRNGNTLQIQDLGNGAFTETDTAGRTALSSSGFGSTGNTISVSGITGTYTLTWESISYNFSTQWNLLESGTYTCYPGNPLSGTFPVLQAITLPNGKQYTFQYSSTYGLLTKITYPSGGWIQYTWGGNPAAVTALFPDSQGNPNACLWRFGKPVLLSRTVSFDGTTTALKQTFQYSTTWPSSPGPNWTSKETTVATQDYIEGTSFTTNYIYSPAASGEPLPRYFGGVDLADTSVPVEQTVSYGDVNGATIKTSTKTWYNAEQLETEQTSLNGGQNAEVTYSYGMGNQVTEKDEYDYGASTPSRKTVTAYQSFAATPIFPTSVSIFDKPCQVVVFDGGGSRTAETDYLYDGGGSVCGTSGTAATSAAAAVQHDETYYGPSSTAPRGNISQEVRWASAGASPATTYTYDETGQVLTMVDPCAAGCSDMSGTSHTTQYSYLDSFTGGGSPPGNTDAYLTQVTYPPTNGVSHVEQLSYDYGKGRLTVHKDQNGRNTTYQYNDGFGRLTLVATPDGGQTTFSYNDSPYNSGANTPNVTTTKSIDSGHSLVTITAGDGIGHSIRTILNSDPDGPDYTDTTYSGMGRVHSISNPYRSTGDQTYGTTIYQHDSLGRTTKVIQSDGTNSEVTTVYSGNCASVTDEAGKVGKTCTDALGRLTGIWEDPNVANYETDYQYDALDNLLTVTQKGGDPNSADWRVRTFQYDSLSRLLSAFNPEAGTISYTYDLDGDLATKVAPGPNNTAVATTTYIYDGLNRLIQKSYSGGNSTPAIKYGYDAVALSGCATSPPSLSDSNPVGYRTAMCDGSGATSWNHDAVGRMLNEKRTIIGSSAVTNTIIDAYNLDGSLYSLTYPGTGKLITYTEGDAGRPLAAQDISDGINYAQSAQYAAFGGLTSMTQGAAPITTTNVYNKRLQPVILSAATTAATIFSQSYDLHLGTGDNGNVFQIVNNRDNNRTQNFLYDSLNRISQAYSSGPNWGETFGPTATSPGVQPTSSGIDPWGNLTNRSGVTGKTSYEPLNCPANASNQLTTCQLIYDGAGNMISNASATYVYDDENRITATAGYTYTYDGDGVRVKKASGSIGVLYWGPGPIAETDLSGNVQHEYIFFNGRRVARRDISGNTVHYYFADQLGSTSVITNATGTMPAEQDLDYYPYGGVASGTSTDHYLFTGKERDSESGLDNFGARYNASTMGRFMSPDPGNIGVNRLNPQSWSAYSYSLNNPLSLTDPTGLYVCEDGEKCDSKNDQAFAKSLADAQTAANNLTGDDKAAAQRAIDAYGAQGVDNGVNVRFDSDVTGGVTEVSGVANGDKSADNPTGQNINVTFNPNAVGGDFSGGLVGHEGSHVADASAWVASGFSPNMNPTNSTTEFNAYRVEFNLGNALGALKAPPGSTYTGGYINFKNGPLSWNAGDTFKKITPDLQQKIKENYQNLNSPAFTKGAVLQP